MLQSPTKLHTLSGLRLEHTNFTRPKPLLLLAYLCLEGKQEKRFLAKLFWPGASNHLNSLAKALSQLRQVGVVDNDDTHAWATVTSDVSEFLEMLERHDLEKAATLYQDSFLSGFYLPDWGVDLEEWVYSTREFLAARLREGLLELAETSEDNKEATRYAERAYELKATLEPDLIPRLYKFLANTPHAAKLKGEAKEFGLERLEKPAPEQSKTIRSNVPARGTSFIGRDIERLELGELLLQEDVRLLTMVGPGGVGKTRLALEVAREAKETFRDGVVYVALESLLTVQEAVSSLAAIFSVQLSSCDDTLNIAKVIENKHVLLLLDNFEHLSHLAPSLATLLKECANLKILVTSRVRLELEEEWLYALEGFSLPDGAGLEDAELNDAVALFVQRARKVKGGFVLTGESLPSVLEICKRVEGLPLGIELAASWAKTLSCEDIAKHLNDLDFLMTSLANIPERQQSLRRVFEGSWGLLSSEEQRVLSQLGTFQGGFSQEAAHAVAGTTLFMLARLSDKSLLRVNAPNRYDFHPLLHGYLQEKLVASGGEAGTRRAHAEYFLNLAEVMKAGRGTEIFQRLEVDLGNFRRAFSWLLAREDSRPRALSLFCSLSKLFMSYGYVREGREWVRAALEVQHEVSPYLADTLHVAGSLARIQGELAQARELYERSRELWQRVGDKDNEIKVLGNLAIVLTEEGQYVLAQKSYELVLAHFKKSGNAGMTVAAFVNLGALYHQQGDFERARELYQECLQVCQAHGNKRVLTACLVNLAEIAYDESNYILVMQYAQDALDLLREVGDKGILAEVLVTAGKAMVELGDVPKAQGYLCESLELYRDMADKSGLVAVLETFATLALARGRAKEAVCLWAITQRQRELLNTPLPPRKQARHEKNLLEARNVLDEAGFTLAWSKGSLTALEAAVAMVEGSLE